jgi:hypothetical protein
MHTPVILYNIRALYAAHLGPWMTQVVEGVQWGYHVVTRLCSCNSRPSVAQCSRWLRSASASSDVGVTRHCIGARAVKRSFQEVLTLRWRQEVLTLHPLMRSADFTSANACIRLLHRKGQSSICMFI